MAQTPQRLEIPLNVTLEIDDNALQPVRKEAAMARNPDPAKTLVEAVLDEVKKAAQRQPDDERLRGILGGLMQPSDDQRRIAGGEEWRHVETAVVTHPGGRRESVREWRRTPRTTPPARSPVEAAGGAVAKQAEQEGLTLSRLRAAYGAGLLPMPDGGTSATAAAVAKAAVPSNELWARQGLARRQTEELIRAIKLNPDEAAARLQALLDSDLAPPTQAPADLRDWNRGGSSQARLGPGGETSGR